MTEQKITCEGCWQPCCDPNCGIIFNFSRPEADMIRMAGGLLKYVWWRKGYEMKNSCPFKYRGGCRLHGTNDQPDCCRDNKAGGKFCRTMRGKLDEAYIH